MYLNSDDGILLECRTESVREFIIWLDGELKQLGGEDKDGLFPVSHEVFEPQRKYLFVKEKYVNMIRRELELWTESFVYEAGKKEDRGG